MSALLIAPPSAPEEACTSGGRALTILGRVAVVVAQASDDVSFVRSPNIAQWCIARGEARGFAPASFASCGALRQDDSLLRPLQSDACDIMSHEKRAKKIHILLGIDT